MTTTQKNANQLHTVQPTSYNGWANYETWAVNLWLSNDQGMYETIRDMVQDAADMGQAAAAIKAFVEDANPLSAGASLYSDLLTTTISRVDWYEVAEAFAEE